MSRPPHHPPHAHRLAAWEGFVLYAAGAVLLFSGGVWLLVHYTVGAGAGEMPHPLEAWSLRLHGLAAFIGVFATGVLAAAHVPHGWRLTRRRHLDTQRNTGLVLCVLAALLVLSGYLLYYFAPESVRPELGWAHAVVGLAMAVLMTAHRRGLRASVRPS